MSEIVAPFQHLITKIITGGYFTDILKVDVICPLKNNAIKKIWALETHNVEIKLDRKCRKHSKNSLGHVFRNSQKTSFMCCKTSWPVHVLHNLGFRGGVYNLLRSINRKQIVKINLILSNKLTIVYGAPQVTPILFLCTFVDENILWWH